MEKINVAELLKDCPQGMELYSPIFGKVYLDKIRPHLAIVVTTDKEQGDFKEEFLYDGRYGMNGECMLFPSKAKPTWEGFVPPYEFKDGDIIYTLVEGDSEFISILKKTIGGLVHCYAILGWKLYVENVCGLCKIDDIVSQRLATEDEKLKLFDAIKDNGYRWNAENKTLEKLIEPKFKIGYRIKKNKDVMSGIVTNISDDGSYKVEYQDGGISYVSLAYQDEWELVPNKFDINTLVPFESRVLVRDGNDEWRGQFFSHYDNYSDRPYICIGIEGLCEYKQCIPYEGNEHLLGTINDCDEYYKTWE